MMARRNKPAQRVKRPSNMPFVPDDWFEPSDDNDVVVCSSANCGKVNKSSMQLDILQDDHLTSSSPPSKSRYNPLSFIKNDSPHHSCHSDRSPPAVVVDCRDDEQFIAYGKSDQQPVSKSHGQYIMSVSSSLPPATSHHRTRSHDAKAVRHSSGSCDPITVLSDEEMDVQNLSDHVMSGDNSSDHVTSGDNSSDHVTSTTIQRNSSIKRKRRKLLTSHKVSDWHPSAIGMDTSDRTTSASTSNNSSTINAASARTESPITVQEDDIVKSDDPITVKGRGSPTNSNTCNLINVEGHGSPTTSNACDPINVEGHGSPTTSNAPDLINVEGHGSPTIGDTCGFKGRNSPVANTCDLTSTEGHDSITAGNTCDLTSVKGLGSSTSDSLERNKRTVGMVTSDTSDRGGVKENKMSSLARSSLTSVKPTNTFYNRSSNRPLYDFVSRSNKTKCKPKPPPLFNLQSKLKKYKIPHKSQSSQQQHTQVSNVNNDNDGDKKKSPLVEALSMIKQSSTTAGSSNTTSNSVESSSTGASNISSSNSHSSKYFKGIRNLERPRLRSCNMGNQKSMLSSVHLDCSRASVGTLHGIAEGATLSVESLSFQLDDGCTPRLFVIAPLENSVQCCKINLERQPYIIQLLLFKNPAQSIAAKAKLSDKVYDPESPDSHVKFIQLWFDMKPSSEACEAINKILERTRSNAIIGWTIERDTISSDEIHDPPTTPSSGTSSNKRMTHVKTYATRSKKSPLQTIKENYTISDDDDDDDVDDKVANDDDDFKSTCDTTKTFRRSTRSSSISKIKPENDKLLLSYRPGTLARAVSIFLSDLDCLEEGEFLNDKIIDFYLKYLWYDKLLNDTNRNRVHVFSPFFHTRLVNNSFGGGKKGINQYDPELLHSRVKNWTKNVDLFSKELVILPVCQSSHWYVAVICHPGLYEATSSSHTKSHSKSRSSSILNESVELIESSGDIISGILDESSSTLIQTSPSSQADCLNDSNIINKSLRPCILMLDSLGAQPRRNNTTAKIRKYLTAEWKHKHNDKEEKDFSNFLVLSQSKLKVPLQENSSDCGLFVLQYVETLLQRVILDNRAIPQTTEEWFTLSDISKKRNNLHELITTLSTTSDVT